MVYSEVRFFISRMDSSGESRDTCFFVNYKRGLTLPKTELDSMSKRKLATQFEEEPFSYVFGCRTFVIEIPDSKIIMAENSKQFLLTKMSFLSIYSDYLKIIPYFCTKLLVI